MALVVHDWGGLIGLRWACDNPGSVRALVISDTGFFADGKWHGMAEALRTEGQGEELMEGMTREGFGAVMAQSSQGIDEAAADEYWKGFGDEDRRRGQLELYRSGDFSKLEPYEGKLGRWACPRCCCGARTTRSRRWPARTASRSRYRVASWWWWRAPGTS